MYRRTSADVLYPNPGESDVPNPLRLSARRRPAHKLSVAKLAPGLSMETPFGAPWRQQFWLRPSRCDNQPMPRRRATEKQRGKSARTVWAASTKPTVAPLVIRAARSAAARCFESRREPRRGGVVGRLFFGYFLLAKQKKGRSMPPTRFSRRATAGPVTSS